MDAEFSEERQLIGRVPNLVSANNTAKKREIFESKLAKTESVESRQSVGQPKEFDTTKFEESVDEIRDVLSRLRPNSNFTCVQQTLDKLLVRIYRIDKLNVLYLERRIK